MTTPQPMAAPDAASFGQVPAAGVIAECLRVQQTVPSRTAAARVFGRSPLTQDSRPWYLGALGEQDVARRLGTIGPGWQVVHSIPIGTRGSDIDHVVIGPGGVFTINTKFHEGAKIWVGARRLLVNGQKTDHLRNARFEGERASRILTSASGMPVAARPLIVIVGAGQMTVREQPEDVAVMREREVVRWLRRRPAVLSPEMVERISLVAGMPATWSSVTPDAPAPDAAAFETLQREVRKAQGIRALWSLAIAAVLLGAAAVVLFSVLGR